MNSNRVTCIVGNDRVPATRTLWVEKTLIILRRQVGFYPSKTELHYPGSTFSLLGYKHKEAPATINHAAKNAQKSSAYGKQDWVSGHAPESSDSLF